MTRILDKELQLSKEESTRVLSINTAIYLQSKERLSGINDLKERKVIKTDLERIRQINYSQILRSQQLEKYKTLIRPPKKKSVKKK